MATKTDAILKVLGIDTEDIQYTTTEVNGLFRRFKEVKKAIDDHEKKVLKPFLFKAAEDMGDRTESGGNKVVTEDGYGWEKRARVSVSVDTEKAKETFRKKGLERYIDKKYSISEENLEEVVKTLESIGKHHLVNVEEVTDQANVEQAYLNQDITDDELGEMVSRKVTYALVEIKPKKKK